MLFILSLKNVFCVLTKAQLPLARTVRNGLELEHVILLAEKQLTGSRAVSRQPRGQVTVEGHGERVEARGESFLQRLGRSFLFSIGGFAGFAETLLLLRP